MKEKRRKEYSKKIEMKGKEKVRKRKGRDKLWNEKNRQEKK